jgi:DNA-binding MarR family transcriptional regulator
VSGSPDYVDRVARIQSEWNRERPDLDVRPHSVIGRLLRLASLQVDQFSLTYKQFGLSSAEFGVLTALRRAGEPFERAPSELAAFTMVTTGAMTKRIDSLEQRGFVTRRPSVSDGRGRVVALTFAGRELIDRAFTEHMRNEHRMLDDLTSAEVDQLEGLLTTWLAAIERSTGARADGDLSRW